MEHATAGIAVPGGLARRAARHRRRRIVTRATAAAGTAVVLAGAAIAATTAAAPRDGGTIASARLVSDIRSALGAAATDDVVRVRASNGQTDLWYYRSAREILMRTEAFSASGQPSLDRGYTVTSTSLTATSVSFQAKNWSTWTVKADLLRQIGRPGLHDTCVAAAICLSFTQDPATLTADIREALSNGKLTRDGTEDIDGVDTIKLVSVRNKPQASADATFLVATTLWVNPATYLPVRLQINTTVTLPDGHTSHAVFSSDVSWLPPTSANLANIRVPIPPRFTQVSHR